MEKQSALEALREELQSAHEAARTIRGGAGSMVSSELRLKLETLVAALVSAEHRLVEIQQLLDEKDRRITQMSSVVIATNMKTF